MVEGHTNNRISTAKMHHFTARVAIDHFTVVCLVTWPLNECEAGVDLALIETSLLFFLRLILLSC